MAHPRILVVDDNPANRALAQATLEDEEYEVLLAEDGARALEQLETNRVDCVLLDVRMPGMDGFEVCRRIRAAKSTHALPVMFLTAQRDVDTFDAARAAGGDDFLTKPLQPAELVLRVQSAIKLAQLNTELRANYDLLLRQRDDLMRLQLMKERLSAFLVHDLKNPVGALDLRAQQALRDPELSDKSRRSLLHIRAEVRTLMRLILNLLDISKGDEGKLSLQAQPFDLVELCAAVANELELKAQMSEVRLAVSTSPTTLCADTELLRRVLANLVENAIRHAPEDSVVEISAHPTDHGARIAVTDRGTGVSDELKARIFDPFIQAEASHRDAQRTGHGLGLTFCRVAVEAHGGTIFVEDAEPGARFVVELPEQSGESS